MAGYSPRSSLRIERLETTPKKQRNLEQQWADTAKRVSLGLGASPKPSEKQPHYHHQQALQQQQRLSAYEGRSSSPSHDRLAYLAAGLTSGRVSPTPVTPQQQDGNPFARPASASRSSFTFVPDELMESVARRSSISSGQGLGSSSSRPTSPLLSPPKTSPRRLSTVSASSPPPKDAKPYVSQRAISPFMGGRSSDKQELIHYLETHQASMQRVLGAPLTAGQQQEQQQWQQGQQSPLNSSSGISRPQSPFALSASAPPSGSGIISRPQSPFSQAGVSNSWSGSQQQQQQQVLPHGALVGPSLPLQSPVHSRTSSAAAALLEHAQLHGNANWQMPRELSLQQGTPLEQAEAMRQASMSSYFETGAAFESQYLQTAVANSGIGGAVRPGSAGSGRNSRYSSPVAGARMSTFGAPAASHTLHSQSGGMRQMMLGEGRASRASVNTIDRQQQARQAKQEWQRQKHQERLQAALNRQLAGSSDEATSDDEGGGAVFLRPSLGPASGSGVHGRSASSIGLGVAGLGANGSETGIARCGRNKSGSGFGSSVGVRGSSASGGIMSRLPVRGSSASGVGVGRRSAAMSPEARAVVHRASVMAYKTPKAATANKGRDAGADWSSSDDSQDEGFLAHASSKRMSLGRPASGSGGARRSGKQGGPRKSLTALKRAANSPWSASSSSDSSDADTDAPPVPRGRTSTTSSAANSAASKQQQRGRRFGPSMFEPSSSSSSDDDAHDSRPAGRLSRAGSVMSASGGRVSLLVQQQERGFRAAARQLPSRSTGNNLGSKAREQASWRPRAKAAAKEQGQLQRRESLSAGIAANTKKAHVMMTLDKRTRSSALAAPPTPTPLALAASLREEDLFASGLSRTSSAGRFNTVEAAYRASGKQASLQRPWSPSSSDFGSDSSDSADGAWQQGARKGGKGRLPGAKLQQKQRRQQAQEQEQQRRRSSWMLSTGAGGLIDADSSSGSSSNSDSSSGGNGGRRAGGLSRRPTTAAAPLERRQSWVSIHRQMSASTGPLGLLNLRQQDSEESSSDGSSSSDWSDDSNVAARQARNAKQAPRLSQTAIAAARRSQRRSSSSTAAPMCRLTSGARLARRSSCSSNGSTRLTPAARRKQAAAAASAQAHSWAAGMIRKLSVKNSQVGPIGRTSSAGLIKAVRKRRCGGSRRSSDEAVAAAAWQLPPDMCAAIQRVSLRHAL